MATSIDPKIEATIIAAIKAHPNGASLKDIIAGFAQPPARRTAQYWMRQVLDAGTVRVDTSSEPYRYFANQQGVDCNDPRLAKQVGNGVANLSGRVANPAGALPTTPSTLPTPGAPLPTGAAVKVGNEVGNPAGFIANVPSNAPMIANPAGRAGARPVANPAGSVANPPPIAKLSGAIANPPVANPPPSIANLPGAAASVANPVGSLPTTPSALPTSGAPLPTGAAVKVGNEVGNGVANPNGSIANLSGDSAIPRLANDPTLAKPVGNGIANVPSAAGAPGVANPSKLIANPRGGASSIANIPGDPGTVGQPVAKSGKSSHKAGHKASAAAPAAGGLTEKEVAKEVTTAIEHPSAWHVGTGVGNLASEWLGRFIPPAWRPALKYVLGGIASAAAIWASAHAGPVWNSSALWYGLAAVLGVGALVLAWRGLRISDTGLRISETRAAETGNRRSETGSPAASSATAGARLPNTGYRVPTTSPRAWHFIGSGVRGLLAVAAGTVPYRRHLANPSDADVQAYLVRLLGAAPVRIVKLVVTPDPLSMDGSRRFNAVVVTTQPLYQPVETEPYLRTHDADAWTKIAAADALLRGPDGERLRAAAGPLPGSDKGQVTVGSDKGQGTSDKIQTAGGDRASSPGSAPSISPSDHPTINAPASAAASHINQETISASDHRNFAERITLLKTLVPVATSAAWSASVLPWRDTNGWNFTPKPTIAVPFHGDPRPAGAAVFAVDEPADVARLEQLLADEVAYADKVQDAAVAGSDKGQVTRESDKGQVPSTKEKAPDGPSDHPTIGSSAPSLDSSAARPLDGSSGYPSQSGAYVLVDGKWQPLPHNNGRFVQTYEQAQLLMKLMGVATDGSEKGQGTLGSDKGRVTSDEGQTTLNAQRSTLNAQVVGTADRPPVGALTFDGEEPMPKISAGNLTLVYIGPRTQPPADALAKYPALRDEPAIEVAPLKIGRGNVRSCTLYFVPPGYTDFGVARIVATLEMPGDTVTVLHTSEPLKAGRYAVSCGSQSFEIVVQ